MSGGVKRLIGIVVWLLFVALLVFLGFKLAGCATKWIGGEAALIAACVALLVALAILFGLYLSGTADYFLSIENPRPLDPNTDRIVIYGWGFAAQSTRSCTAELAGQGFADVRMFARRRDVLRGILTFGFARPVSIVWRGNAGQHPLGQA